MILNLPIKGTFAHEMPMIWAAIADAKGEDIRASHGKFIDTWLKRYGKDLSVLYLILLVVTSSLTI